MKFTLGSSTDHGRRQNNEDSHAIVDVEALGLQADAALVIADGMGGRNFGEQASQAAVEAVIDTLKDRLAVGKGSISPAAILKTALHQANEYVYQLSQRDEESEGMGTTCVVAVISDSRLCIGHAGDSRAYALYKGRLEQLTDDHSFVAEQVRSGMITEEKARKSRFRNVITRAVGIEPMIEPDVVEYPLEGIDAVILCTDGLSNVITDRDIEHVLLTCNDAQSGADKLVKMAKQAGGSDNITAVVAHFGDGPITQLPEDETTSNGTGGFADQMGKLPTINPTMILSALLALTCLWLAYTCGQLLQNGYLWSAMPPFLHKAPPPPPPVQRDLAHLKYSAPQQLMPYPVRAEPLLVTPSGKTITAVLSTGDVVELAADGSTQYQFPWTHLAGLPPAPSGGSDITADADATRGRGHPSNWHTATDSQGNLYVADADAHTITKFKANGEMIGVIRSVGDDGATSGDLCPECDTVMIPEAIAVNAAGDLYVVDGSELKLLRAQPSK